MSKKMAGLNEVLRWSVEKTAEKRNESGGESLSQHQPHQRLDWNDPAVRGVMDQMFPDEYGEIHRLIEVVRSSEVHEELVEALVKLEEWVQDINYAINIDKVGALSAVLARFLCAADSAEVRSLCLWVLGTAMQDTASVKDDVVEKGGHKIIVAGLLDSANPSVRSKALFATSALLRFSSSHVRQAFEEEQQALDALCGCFSDQDANVRRRALFFLKHAQGNDLGWVLEAARKRPHVTCYLEGLKRQGSLDQDELALVNDCLEQLQNATPPLLTNAS
mmetsp:Transcript_16015/g.32207  ORF Transcript_16015/g.32207 Transcript_16015/m.32207 type:complete len:277 (-) Transcript_16015:1643-2473(-)